MIEIARGMYCYRYDTLRISQSRMSALALKGRPRHLTAGRHETECMHTRAQQSLTSCDAFCHAVRAAGRFCDARQIVSLLKIDDQYISQSAQSVPAHIKGRTQLARCARGATLSCMSADGIDRAPGHECWHDSTPAPFLVTLTGKGVHQARSSNPVPREGKHLRAGAH